MENTAAAEERHPMRAELRSMTRGLNLVVLIVAIAVGLWGAFDSMSDAGGDRFGGALAIGAPGLYAGWCMLEMAWARLESVASVFVRVLASCFIAPLLVAVPVGIVVAIAVAFPGVRQLIADAAMQNDGRHFWWGDGIGASLIQFPLGGIVVGMVVALGVVLIIVLPVVSIRAPRIAAAGSHLEKVDAGRRDSTTAFVFTGLGMTILGIALWVFGDGEGIERFPEYAGRFVQALARGYAPPWYEAIWLVGVVLVVIGVLVMGWGCVRVLSARRRAAGD